MREFLRLLRTDQRGVTTIEYGLIVMAIALALMAAYFLAGDALKEVMFALPEELQHVQSAIDNGE